MLRGRALWLGLLLLGCTRGGPGTPAASREVILGAVSIHPQLEGWVGEGGSLMVRLISLGERRTVAAKTLPAPALPLEFRFDLGDGIGASELRALDADGFYVEAIYESDLAPRPLAGEAWGRIGKPYPMRLGERADITLAFIVQPDEPIAAEPVELPDDSASPVLVHGTIVPDPHLPVVPGGVLHLRLISLSQSRPFVFLRYESVRFPMTFAVRAQERFHPAKSEFYVDATYTPPGTPEPFGRSTSAPAATFGEAWGKAGAPHPLAIGDRADIVLARLWTDRLMRGGLANVQAATLDGWLFVDRGLESHVGTNNRLVLAVLGTEGTGTPRLVAAKRFDDIDPERPIAYHFTAADFFVTPDPTWRVRYVARLETLGSENTVVSRLLGGRASRYTGIGTGARNLRIGLDRASDADPLADLPELAQLDPSDVTSE